MLLQFPSSREFRVPDVYHYNLVAGAPTMPILGPQQTILTFAVCIPTFRRPKMLRHLLNALSEMSTSAAIVVLVADNDVERHEGSDLCKDLASSYRWPLRTFIVAERGIAQARNALVAEALSLNDVVSVVRTFGADRGVN